MFSILFRINWFKLLRKMRELGHPPVKWLPKDYWPESEGGGGREWHDDWGIMLRDEEGNLRKKPVWWQPWQYVKRINNAYAIPVPMKRVAGNSPYEEMVVVNDDYPITPGADFIVKDAWDDPRKVTRPLRHFQTMMSIAKPGKWFVSAAWMGGEWVPCYWARTIKVPFTDKVIKMYCGLKIDQDGPMAYFPELSLSYKLF